MTQPESISTWQKEPFGTILETEPENDCTSVFPSSRYSNCVKSFDSNNALKSGWSPGVICITTLTAPFELAKVVSAARSTVWPLNDKVSAIGGGYLRYSASANSIEKAVSFSKNLRYDSVSGLFEPKTCGIGLQARQNRLRNS